MKCKYNDGCYIWYPGNWSIQLHHPGWSFTNNDFYIRAVDIVRFMWNSTDYNHPKEKHYGFGFTILGFGFGAIYKKILDKQE